MSFSSNSLEKSLLNRAAFQMNWKRAGAAVIVAASLTAGVGNVQAVSGTWSSDASGSWNTSTTSTWVSGVVASGADSVADFNSVDITATRTVTLTASMTIGGLVFGDVTANNSWTLAASGGAILTLQTTTGTPTITVNPLGSGKVAIISVALGGNQGLIKDGSGTLVLSGSNVTTGGLAGTVSVNAGTLRVENSNAVGDVYLATSSSILDGPQVTSNSVTLSGTISGAGKVTKGNGTSILILTGSNTYQGGTTLSDGALLIGNDYALGSGTLSINGGRFGSADNTARTISNAVTFTSAAALILGGAQGGTGQGDLTFTATNTSSLGGSKTLTVNNATTATFTNNWTGNSGWGITKAGTGKLVLNGNIATVNSVFVTVNAGTMELNGTNSNTGATTVNGGTLLVNGLTNGSAATVNSGGTLGGIGSLKSLTLNAGGLIAPGKDGIGTLHTNNGAFTWNGETSDLLPQIQFELGNTGGQGALAVSDLLDLGTGVFTKGTGTAFVFDFQDTGAAGNTYTLVTFGSTTFTDVSDFSYTGLTDGLSATFSLNNNSLELTVVPEPSTGLMVFAGLGAWAAASRLRRRVK